MIINHLQSKIAEKIRVTTSNHLAKFSEDKADFFFGAGMSSHFKQPADSAGISRPPDSCR